MGALCYRCKRPGHKAMFCHRTDSPNDAWTDSGDQAFNQLPFNTTRWQILKARRAATLDALEKADTPEKKLDILSDFMADVFASGWRYCCLKMNCGSTSHEATEPRTISKSTTATATTDSETDDGEPDDCQNQSTAEGCAEPQPQPDSSEEEAAALFLIA